MSNRIELALAACEGLSNDELVKRGKGGFAKMINRKRAYASAARTLHAAGGVIAAKLQDAQQELTKAQATIAQIEAMDEPITDTSLAAELIANAIKGKSE